MVDFYAFEVGLDRVLVVYTFAGTLFTTMWSIFIHLGVIYTIGVDFYTFEGGFIHLREFIHLRVQHPVCLYQPNAN